MVWTMEDRDSRRQDEFWAAYRRCAEENRVPPDRSQYYLRWVKDFVEFIPEKRLKARSGKDIEAFLAALGQREGIAHWQVRQAEHALRILYEIFLPQYSVTGPAVAGPANQPASRGAAAKTQRFRDRAIPGEVERRFSQVVEAVRTAVRTRHYSYRTELSYLDWVRRFIAFHRYTVQELLGHANVATTMIYTHVLNRPGLSVKSPADI